MASYVIGIDVGGTNTDAVCLDGNTIVESCKVPTTSDVTSGVRKALEELLGKLKGMNVESNIAVFYKGPTTSDGTSVVLRANRRPCGQSGWVFELKTCRATGNPQFPQTRLDRTRSKPVRGRRTFLRIFLVGSGQGILFRVSPGRV